MKRISLMFFIAVFAQSCITMDRSRSSGYTGNSLNNEQDDTGEPYDEREVRNLSPEERELYEDRMLLSRLEKAITTSEERAQYNRYKSTLESDKERLEFLALENYNSKERYLSSKGYTATPNRHPRDVASLIEQNDVAVGMGRQAVLESWGDPAQVEVAGRRENGNERWIYKEYISTPEGFQEEHRVLYFENGRLVGWEKN